MRKRKLEYFMNAIIYSLDRMADATAGELIYKSVAVLIKFIRLFLPKNLKERFDAHLKRNEKGRAMVRRQNSYLNAKRLIPLLCAFFGCAIYIFLDKMFERLKIHVDSSIIDISAIILIFFIFKPFFNTIDDDIYAGYAKFFDKKDKEWHIRWRLITIALCVSIFLGFFLILEL